MGEEYRARVFKSGNSLALRLPKALGLKEGAEMRVREDQGRYIAEPVEAAKRRIDLTGVWGAIPGLTRMEEEEGAPRDWPSPGDDG